MLTDLGNSALQSMSNYRENHYVPRWYQERFLPPGEKNRKFFYLDLRPDRITSGGHTYSRNALLRWGTQRCFKETDLYTTQFGSWHSTAIERFFFGDIDNRSRSALDYFGEFRHPSVNDKAFQDLILFMSVQKLRTPKGLAVLSDFTNLNDRNSVLIALQQLRQMYAATWTECVWSIADASDSDVKFIISDHPVTVYSIGCFPGSKYCRGYRDPDIRLCGTHTLFPLNPNKILILTNISWLRNPYGKPTAIRPNPGLFRSAIFNFMQIQIGRKLSTVEVQEMNYVIKQRAYRYIAAATESWLYPEEAIPSPRWDKLGLGYLFMPEPRAVDYSTGYVMGYGHGRGEAWDEYGRRPGQPGFRSGVGPDWNTFMAFKGEFARLFGPERRGRAFNVGKLDPEKDDSEMYQWYLGLEGQYKARASVHSKNRKRN